MQILQGLQCGIEVIIVEGRVQINRIKLRIAQDLAGRTCVSGTADADAPNALSRMAVG